jgi:hypothetical protein
VASHRPACNDRPSRRSLRHASPLPATLRRPWLAELPASISTEDVRCAAGTIASDERLYALLGHAQRLGAAGRLRDADWVVEAVACSFDLARKRPRVALEAMLDHLTGLSAFAAIQDEIRAADFKKRPAFAITGYGDEGIDLLTRALDDLVAHPPEG